MKSHDAAVITMLREDPDMGVDYLRTAFDELDEEGGGIGIFYGASPCGGSPRVEWQ